jgi:hypothetical protein
MLRKRLDCHYCGKRLNAARKSNNRINCTNCLADNYFDANNNLTDVPVSEVIGSGPQSTQSAEVESTSTIFCKTCLTNQSFYQRALADYLPDEDDPSYPELVEALDVFEKELELRYPRCCVQCAPKVQAQIQKANYTAKTDHLRRLMHRKHGHQTTPALRLRSIFISMAGFGNLFALALQLFWHVSAIQVRDSATPAGKVAPLACLRTWPASRDCTEYTASMVPVSLFVGLLCIWWNPKWQSRLSGQDGRLRGLRTYYLAQLSLLAVRFVVWVAIDELSSLKPYTSIIHSVAFAFLTLSSLYAYLGPIELDSTPLVDWSQVKRPLVEPDQFRPPTQRHIPAAETPSAPDYLVGSLAGPSQAHFDQWQPPIPPSDDSMDWESTSLSFNPRPRIPKPRFDQPSPFHGTLAAPPSRGSLHPNRSQQSTQQRAIGVPPGFFGLSKSRNHAQDDVSNGATGINFAPAKFFAHEREADTGLEKIFDQMFSVQDPHESSARKAAFSRGQSRSQTSTKDAKFGGSAIAAGTRPSIVRMALCCTIIIALVVVTISACIIDSILPEARQTASNIMPWLATIPILHLIGQLLLSGQAGPEFLIVPALQGLILLSMHFFRPADGSEYVSLWNKLVVAVACFLLLQEIYLFCQLQDPSTNTGTNIRTARKDSRAITKNSEYTDTPASAPIRHPSTPIEAPGYISELSSAGAMHARPQPRQGNPLAAHLASTSSIRKQASDESISSVSSIQTTSTAPGWKTPRNENRTYDWREQEKTPRRQSSNIDRGLGGLTLDNDFGIGSGTGIAGPRTRSRAQGNRNAFGGGSYR